MQTLVSVGLIAIVMSLAVEAQSKAPVPAAPEAFKENGVKIPGWKVRFDVPDTKIERVYFRRMGGGMHVTTGPGAILWKPDQRAIGVFKVTAFFSATVLPGRQQTYGVFIGGTDLAGRMERYTSFVAREDGRFLIETVRGSQRVTNVDWMESQALSRPDAGGNVYNQLTIRVDREAATFLANERAVATVPAAQLETQGITGLRVLGGADIHIAYFSVQKLTPATVSWAPSSKRRVERCSSN